MATAASKLNSAYWRKRTLQQAERQIQADAQVSLSIKQDYERLLHELDRELAVFYARYAQNESISMVEARRLLRDAELEDFRMSLDEFREKAIAGGFDKELDEIYLRSRVSRLQALQTQIELRIQELFQSQEEQLRNRLSEVYTDTYYQTVYAVSQQTAVHASFARINAEMLEHVLSQPWLGSDFSSRIWADQDKLLRELKQELSRAFVLGEPLKKTTKRVAERMGVSERRAATLVQTESAHMAAQATAKGYEETGVKEYQFDASLDLKTCPTCGAMDGKTFRASERETGVNYPPLHPRCRCTTMPVTEFDMDGKRAARNPVTGKTEYVEQGMTYAEWHKKYVENDPEGAILELSKRDKNALQKYISADSYSLNDKLRNGEPLSQAEQRWIKQLDHALDELPVYEGTVYRSLSSDMVSDKELFFVQHEVGAFVTYDAYTSTSTEIYDPSMDIQLIIQSKSGRDMRGINTPEKEILFKRKTYFKVDRKEGNTIWMTEI